MVQFVFVLLFFTDNRCLLSSLNCIGNACQCVTALCPTNGGQACSGHGQCACDGTCSTCDSGWDHPDGGPNDCSCNLSPTACPLDSSGQPCRGVGTCVCGECECQTGFSGSECQNCDELIVAECPVANQAVCQAVSSCSACVLAENNDMESNICVWCESTGTCVAVAESAAQTCTGGAKNSTADCPTITSKSSVPAIAGGAVGAAAIGILAILLWKCFQVRNDKRIERERERNGSSEQMCSESS